MVSVKVEKPLIAMHHRNIQLSFLSVVTNITTFTKK